MIRLLFAAERQFGKEDADFDGFPEAARIREKDAVPDLGESPEGRAELVRQCINNCPWTNPQIGIGGWRLPEQAREAPGTIRYFRGRVA